MGLHTLRQRTYEVLRYNDFVFLLLRDNEFVNYGEIDFVPEKKDRLLPSIDSGDYNLEFPLRVNDYFKLLNFTGTVPVAALRGLRVRAHELH